jgi:prepilin-type processing-associated H-X9-DG protein
MHQMGLLVAIYQADNKGCFPPIWQSSSDLTNPNDGNAWQSQDKLLWALLNIPASTNVRICPALIGRLDSQAIAPSNFGVRGTYSYRYSAMLAGFAKGVYYPGAQVGGDGLLHPTIVKRVPNDSSTLMWLDYPQLVVFSMTDNRGAVFEPTYGAWNGVNYIPSGYTNQGFYDIAPTHYVVPAAQTKFGSLSNGSPSLAGKINICFADGSARTLPVVMGNITNQCTDAPQDVLDQTTSNGCIMAGSLGFLSGVRFDPAAAP